MVVFKERLGGSVMIGTCVVFLAGIVLWLIGRCRPALGGGADRGGVLRLGGRQGVTAALDELARSHIILAKRIVAGSANLVITRHGVEASWSNTAASSIDPPSTMNIHPTDPISEPFQLVLPSVRGRPTRDRSAMDWGFRDLMIICAPCDERTVAGYGEDEDYCGC